MAATAGWNMAMNHPNVCLIFLKNYRPYFAFPSYRFDKIFPFHGGINQMRVHFAYPRVEG